jgi:hypothetical protein
MRRAIAIPDSAFAEAEDLAEQPAISRSEYQTRHQFPATGDLDSRGLELTQLAVFAATAVIARKMSGIPIVTLLAGNAKAHAQYCRPARLRYRRATVRTLAEGFTLRQAAPGSTYAVLDGRVDLLVDRVVSCPAGSHVALLEKDQSAERW